jgi:NAD(P)-dependent dehydrogenase (short-subunit alcohol dehydrogenase family)
MSELDGAVTVITGGSGGVGRALAREAAGRGSKLVLADIVDSSEAVSELRAAGATAEGFQTDVSDYSSVQELEKFTTSTFGEVNVLVNCAVGTAGATGPLQEIADPSLVKRAFEVNILGYFNGIHAFAERLTAAAAAGRPAYLMNVGSEHSFGVPPHVMPASAYTVSKYTMLGFTDVALRDFAGTGVNVSLFAPGWILTPKVRQFAEQSDDFAAHVRPYAQTTEYIARRAFDGLLAKEYIIFPNPKSVPFAIDHAERILAELRRALEVGQAETAGDVWAQF